MRYSPKFHKQWSEMLDRDGVRNSVRRRRCRPSSAGRGDRIGSGRPKRSVSLPPASSRMTSGRAGVPEFCAGAGVNVDVAFAAMR